MYPGGGPSAGYPQGPPQMMQNASMIPPDPMLGMELAGLEVSYFHSLFRRIHYL
jgi:hypothetical protein